MAQTIQQVAQEYKVLSGKIKALEAELKPLRKQLEAWADSNYEGAPLSIEGLTIESTQRISFTYDERLLDADWFERALDANYKAFRLVFDPKEMDRLPTDLLDDIRLEAEIKNSWRVKG